MTEALDCLHMNHINALVEDFDQSIDHFSDLLGAQFNYDLPGAHWHACLITIGGVMFEIFAPIEYLLHARMGPHYVGVEYVVPDVDRARAETLDRGMRVIRELGEAFHVHPAEAFGVAWEFFHKSFQDPVAPPVPYDEPIWSAERWLEHPIGYTGLKRYSVAVADLDAALGFAQSYLGASVLYEEERPGVVAQAVGLGLGDTVVELISPRGAGPIERFVARYGDGIRSTVFAVRDLARTERYFAQRGIVLQPGDAPDSLALAPEDSMGLLFEFSA
jgi:catechol 2,3-dioxygenase-like lactoylglutathione lyase family enzyme